MDNHLKIVLILTVGFATASLFAYIMQRLKLPSILGFLLAGYVIGPYSPGFVADLKLAEELAEIGVILMLFGVGLHFKLQDLVNVKNVAIPGAIGQTLVAAIVATAWIYYLGWPIQNGIIIGLSVGVASTVVLMRVLSDNHLLDTLQGHIAVGWLIVEDILTVAVLILLPMLANYIHESTLSYTDVIASIIFVLIKFIVLAVILFTVGQRIVSYLLTNVARLRSHELFTITVLALTFVIATGSSFIFGTSIALGAFLAGMIIGQTDVRHQAAANALPVKDLFAVIFFLSVGMLFNPAAISEHFSLFASVLTVILIIKPLVAVLIVLFLRYPLHIALTVAIALAQIGEFSFILAEQAMQLKLLPDQGFDVLVACALISISLNPLLFRLLLKLEKRTSKATFARALRAKVLKNPLNKIAHLFDFQKPSPPKVIVVGFGPIGQSVTHTLEKLGIACVIVEQNIDTVPLLKDQERHVVYGDAAQPNILESIHIASARLLVITVPDTAVAEAIIKSAHHLNPQIRILARIRYLADQPLMEALKVKFVCCEKESAKAFSEMVTNLVKHL